MAEGGRDLTRLHGMAPDCRHRTLLRHVLREGGHGQLADEGSHAMALAGGSPCGRSAWPARPGVSGILISSCGNSSFGMSSLRRPSSPVASCLLLACLCFYLALLKSCWPPGTAGTDLVVAKLHGSVSREWVGTLRAPSSSQPCYMGPCRWCGGVAASKFLLHVGTVNFVPCCPLRCRAASDVAY